jgi:uncharacterized membrane protein
MNNQNHALETNAVKMLLDGSVILFIGYSFLNLNFTWHAIKYSALLGLIYGLSGVLYFKALKEMNVTKVIPIAQSSRLALVFILSLVFLGESAGKSEFVGVALISIGILPIVMDSFEIPEFSAGLKFLLANLGLAVTHKLLVKAFVSGINPETLSTLMYFSSGIFLMIYIQYSKGLGSLTDNNLPKIGFAAFFGAIATLTLFKALELAEASQVYPLAGAQSVFIALISAVFLTEQITTLRLLGIFTVIIGIYLLQT